MSKNIAPETEALPHKKWGKNHTKTSPTKHGCEKNEFNAHEYEVFNKVVVLPYNRLRTVLQTRCVHCGKQKRGVDKSATAITTILEHKEKGWVEVDVRYFSDKKTGTIKIMSSMNW